MNVAKIGLNTTTMPKQAQFKSHHKEQEYENPVSRSMERNLAILSSVGVAGIVGFIAGGLSTLPFENKKYAYGIGAAVAALTLAFTLPAKIYHTKVNVYVKEKEMDVFSRDRNLKTNLTEDVDKEVMDESVSLDKKLDDNLKLQMANRGAAVGIANMNPAQTPAAAAVIQPQVQTPVKG